MNQEPAFRDPRATYRNFALKQIRRTADTFGEKLMNYSKIAGYAMVGGETRL